MRTMLRPEFTVHIARRMGRLTVPVRNGHLGKRFFLDDVFRAEPKHSLHSGIRNDVLEHPQQSCSESEQYHAAVDL